LTLSGTKDQSDGLVYVHLDHSGGFLASGFYGVESQPLRALRTRIVDESVEFLRIVKRLSKLGFEFDTAYHLKRMPRGFEAHADEPIADLLRLKSFVVRQPLHRSDWLDGSVTSKIVRMNKASTELTLFGIETFRAAVKSKRKGV
ncbi:MAG: DUF2461 family protein, partial [Planctomycetota bacterium]